MGTDTDKRMRTFVEYGRSLKGYEKGEAQVFCDRLFQAFGHDGYKEAGASLEFQVKKREGRGTKFADLLWAPRVLVEMKSKGEALSKHYRQAFDYWLNLVPDRPRYVVLCNFDEFWIYDFNTQLDSPVDSVSIDELPERYTALNFLFPNDPRPLFGNDKVQVTREAADKVAQVFSALVEGGESRERAQRFVLQSVVSMFAEDFDLLPKDLFTSILSDCAEGADSYDLIGGLFRQMASEEAARGGRFKDVRYFNGGLFSTVEPVGLGKAECELMLAAASEQWGKVAPPIFGTLFQSSMDQGKRHALGAHFTSEADIQEIVRPTIVDPWHALIRQADTLGELESLSDDLLKFRVLDPACGSGNFLYVAYRELVNLEMEILGKIHEKFGAKARKKAGTNTLVSTKQFYGLDLDPFAAELAKVTLMLAKRIAVAETRESRFSEQQDLPFEFEKPLPLDNLDQNIVVDDALFCDWPAADVIIGNPPYQSKNKMQREYGPAYVNKVRAQYPDVPGRADYCVYWFRRAHDELQQGGRAGLVGTNTIRQNYSREGGLDYIVDNGGVINHAWSTKVWSGEAAVHVSIVNWVKGEHAGVKTLFRQEGDHVDSPLLKLELERISASLSGGADVTKAKKIPANAKPKTTHQGQTHGHEGFLLETSEAHALIAKNRALAEVIFPFLTIDELLEASPPRISRYVIDFHPRDLLTAQGFGSPFERIEQLVLPKREEAARRELENNDKALGSNPKARVNWHHKNFLRRWWLMSYPREALMKEIRGMPRYIVCGQVTKRPIFAFLPQEVHPNAALQVFAFDDDYSFGVLQSQPHWDWFTERCSTLKGDWRYTSTTVYDSFPWPQSPTIGEVKGVAQAGKDLRAVRNRLMDEHQLSLRELYRSLDKPGTHPMKDAQEKLAAAVRAAYGMKKKDDTVGFLFDLNQTLAGQKSGVVGPGLPPCVRDRSEFVSSDAMTFEGLAP